MISNNSIIINVSSEDLRADSKDNIEIYSIKYHDSKNTTYSEFCKIMEKAVNIIDDAEITRNKDRIYIIVIGVLIGLYQLP